MGRNFEQIDAKQSVEKARSRSFCFILRNKFINSACKTEVQKYLKRDMLLLQKENTYIYCAANGLFVIV
jgi:hypothetical protein